MKTIYTTILLFILVVFSSCKKTETEPIIVEPISTFDTPFPKKNKNLSNILGDELEIRNGYDTLILKIISTKKDNLITYSKTGDTLFYGQVSKYKGLYYFTEKLNDSSYRISAVKIKGNLIYGLKDYYFQYFSVDDEIKKGNFKKLVKYINADTTAIRLRSDKKEMHKLFNLIISNTIPDTIINYNKPNIVDDQQTISKNAIETNNQSNILKTYPNPTTDYINVELKQKGEFPYQFTDINGRIILQGKLNEIENKIVFGKQPRGIYFLTIINSENQVKETIKVVVK